MEPSGEAQTLTQKELVLTALERVVQRENSLTLMKGGVDLFARDKKLFAKYAFGVVISLVITVVLCVAFYFLFQLFAKDGPQFIEPATAPRELSHKLFGCIGGIFEKHKTGHVKGPLGRLQAQERGILKTEFLHSHLLTCRWGKFGDLHFRYSPHTQDFRSTKCPGYCGKSR